MRTIAVVTVDRSDFGIYRSLLRELAADPMVQLQLIVSGTHLAPEFGATLQAIEGEGFVVADRVEMLLSSDSPEGVAKSVGLGVIGFAQVFARSQPDLLVVLGDRFEMYAAAVAALPFRLPVAHIHGGELTFGAIDESIRHSLTKLSHLHFASTDDSGRRLRQLGEEPWRIAVVGAPALDSVADIAPLSRDELARRLGVPLDRPPVVVTFHPMTLDEADAMQQADTLLQALAPVAGPLVFTRPNADVGGRAIGRAIDTFVAAHPSAVQVGTLGSQGYFSLLGTAAAMVGNSSSGIIEAPSFALPVVNIGTRQDGRVRAMNVIDVPCDVTGITAGIEQALDPTFRASLIGMTNPYRPAGRASAAIAERLRSVPLDQRLLVKHFCDLSSNQ